MHIEKISNSILIAVAIWGIKSARLSDDEPLSLYFEEDTRACSNLLKTKSDRFLRSVSISPVACICIQIMSGFGFPITQSSIRDADITYGYGFSFGAELGAFITSFGIKACLGTHTIYHIFFSCSKKGIPPS